MISVKPTLHINGTSVEELLHQYTEQGRMIRDAIRICEACGPNGRDYYPQGPDAFRLAVADQVARLEALQAMLQEFSALAEHCAAERDAREARRSR